MPGTIEAGFDGAKMLLRLDLRDAATVSTMESCAKVISELNRAELIALVEPFMSQPGGRQSGRGSSTTSARTR